MKNKSLTRPFTWVDKIVGYVRSADQSCVNKVHHDLGQRPLTGPFYKDRDVGGTLLDFSETLTD